MLYSEYLWQESNELRTITAGELMDTQLCWCVSEGTRFLDHDTRQTDALHLAPEDTNARLQER